MWYLVPGKLMALDARARDTFRHGIVTCGYHIAMHQLGFILVGIFRR